MAAPSGMTGVDLTRWDEMIEQLGVARHAQREAALHHRRGGTRRKAAGTGRKPVITLADRAAMTLLYQRFSPPQRTLAELFGVTQQTIHNIIRQTRPLLDAVGYTPEPAGIRLTTKAEFVQYTTDISATPPDQIDQASY